MELTIHQFDQLRAKQRENEAVLPFAGSDHLKARLLKLPKIDAHTARLAIAEVNREYAANPLLGRTAPKA